MKQKNQTKKNKFKKGSTLVESLVAVFVFALASVMIAGSFASFYKNYQNTRNVQRGAESAQYALNQMAKTLKTSKVTTTAVFPLRAYDYSRSTGNCIGYDFSDNKIVMDSSSPITAGDPTTCSFGNAANFSDLTLNDVSAAFVDATASTPAIRGKVTISLMIKEAGSTSAPVPVQMTVSLRQ